MDYWITKILHFIMFANVYSQQFFNTMPPPVNTNFTCKGRDTGFYADLETNCRVYHTCDENGNKFTYYCPAETAFRQEALVCDHAHLVDCAKGRRISKIPKIIENNEKNTNKEIQDDGRYYSSSYNENSSSRDDEKVVTKRVDAFQPESSNSAYTRSFRITQEPRSHFSTVKSFNGQQQQQQQQQQQRPTFVLSSSVFLRDRPNFKTNPSILQNNRLAKKDDTKNFNNSEQSTNVRSNENKEERREEYTRFFSSPISTTTLRPFVEDFRANQHNRGPMMIFGSSSFEKEEETTEPFRETFFSTTTKRPFVLDSRVNYRNIDNSEMQNFEKFKLNYEINTGENAGISGIREKSNEKMSFSDEIPREFKFGEKSTRDEKIVTNNNFQGQSTSNQRESESEHAVRNREEMLEILPKVGMILKNSETRNKNSKELKISIHERPPFFHDNSNFPYSETLRSIQGITEDPMETNLSMKKFDYTMFSTSTTLSPVTIAGTEFPVLPFAGTYSPLGPNELDDDPYYPKHSTTTEAHYKLSDHDDVNKKPFRFSTKRPWPGSLNFEIPEVLPDLNTLDDLVDRRKFFYIPRVKAT